MNGEKNRQFHSVKWNYVFWFNFMIRSLVVLFFTRLHRKTFFMVSHLIEYSIRVRDVDWCLATIAGYPLRMELGRCQFCIFHNKTDRRELLVGDLHSAGFFVVSCALLILFYFRFHCLWDFRLWHSFLKWSIFNSWQIKCSSKFWNELEKFCSAFASRGVDEKVETLCPTRIEIFAFSKVFKGHVDTMRWHYTLHPAQECS